MSRPRCCRWGACPPKTADVQSCNDCFVTTLACHQGRRALLTSTDLIGSIHQVDPAGSSPTLADVGATAGSAVTVAIGDETLTTTVGDDGNWRRQ
jgi:hypothetical protein